MNHQHFDHEKLKVYQLSIDFVGWTNEFSNQFRGYKVIRDQLERASISIPLNIAEGNGKFRANDRCRFFDIARGSALECSACLDVLAQKGLITEAESQHAKNTLIEIVRMITGLIKSNSKSRTY